MANLRQVFDYWTYYWLLRKIVRMIRSMFGLGLTPPDMPPIVTRF